MEKGQKYFDNRRKEIKMCKRGLKNANFNTSTERKNAIESLKKDYRANKRAEKHELKKKIKEELE